MSSQVVHIYEFADFRLIPTERLLLHKGEQVALAPKAFSTLVILVEQHGHLVEKAELIERIWENAFVEEAAVSRCVWGIRNALGEDSKNKKFIQTVPKRGYRFVGEVSVVPAEKEQSRDKSSDTLQIDTVLNGDGSSAASLIRRSRRSASEVIIPEEENESRTIRVAPPGEQPKRKTALIPDLPTERLEPVNRIRPLLAASGLALLVGAIGLGYYFFNAGKTALNVIDKKSIAVLPLKPINSANRDEIYEIGIADSLILKLESMKGFVVRPLNATRKYADIEQDSLAAGREQQVDYLLASNYQLAGGRIRITAQLFNVESGQIEETYKIEKDARDVFAMQDAIADDVGNKLSARFGSTSSGATAKRGTTSEEAYRLYLQGIYLNDKRTTSDSRKAVEAFEQAIRLDPNYARAWAGKAHAHRSFSNFGNRDTNVHVEHQQSMDAINKALDLDQNLSEAYSVLCENKMYYEYDFAGAEVACKRAIELKSDSPQAHNIYARFLMGPGRRFDEAITEIKTAIDLDPASYYHQAIYKIVLTYARRYDEADQQLERLAAMNPNGAVVGFWYVGGVEMQGNNSEAFERLMRFQTLAKTDEETRQLYKTAYQTSGWQGVLRERAKWLYEYNLTHSYFSACVTAQIGDRDKAFEYLEKSYQERELWMAYLQVDPRLDTLRGDPRFVQMVRRLGPPH